MNLLYRDLKSFVVFIYPEPNTPSPPLNPFSSKTLIMLVTLFIYFLLAPLFIFVRVNTYKPKRTCDPSLWPVELLRGVDPWCGGRFLTTELYNT